MKTRWTVCILFGDHADPPKVVPDCPGSGNAK